MSDFISLSVFSTFFGKKPKAAVFDLDGTVASVIHREHFVENGKMKDWSSFHGHMTQDSPIPSMVDTMRKHKADGEKVIIVSLRPERYMDQVIEWLDANDIPHDEIHLRPDGDYRPGVQVKRSIYRELLDPRFNVTMSYDDNPKMVQMWSEELGDVRVQQAVDPNVPPNLDIDPAEDPKYPFGRPGEKVIGDDLQMPLFDDPEAHEIQQYKTENLFTEKSVGGRVYVPPYTRATPKGDIIHVDGYWRTLSADGSAADRLRLLLSDD